MSNDVVRVIVESLDTGKPYATATIVSGLVFVSGLIPSADASTVARMTLREQITSVLDALDTTLHACGTTIASIVKTTCYLVDRDDFAAFNEVYAQRVGAPFPSRTTVVTQLAAPGVRFEMDAVAAVEDPAPGSGRSR
jgi:2-iminobutanoate/2-iminopropanoate deaminase